MTELPSCKCPECSGKMIPMEISFGCEKCANIYNTNLELILSNIKLSKLDIDKLSKYLKHKIYLDALITPKVNNDQKNSRINVTYEGEVYEAILDLKEKFKLKSIKDAVIIIQTGFLAILKIMSDMPGDKYFITDDKGNKSNELTRVILKNAEEEFFNIKAKKEVDIFTQQMANLFKINELKGNINE